MKLIKLTQIEERGMLSIDPETITSIAEVTNPTRKHTMIRGKGEHDIWCVVETGEDIMRLIFDEPSP